MSKFELFKVIKDGKLVDGRVLESIMLEGCSLLTVLDLVSANIIYERSQSTLSYTYFCHLSRGLIRHGL